MRVISKKRFREFWDQRKADAEQAERDLSTWYKIAKGADWGNFAALKQTFGSADQVGNCVVFDVGNNRFRLIGRVNYVAGRLYVLKVMDHQEYDKQNWIDNCGCHKPPPKPVAKEASSPARRPTTHRRKKKR